jgi:hypothetical protein
MPGEKRVVTRRWDRGLALLALAGLGIWLCAPAVRGEGPGGSIRTGGAAPAPLRAWFAPEPSAPRGERGGPKPPSYLGKAVQRGPDGALRPVGAGVPASGATSAASIGVGTGVFVSDGAETAVVVDIANGSLLATVFNKGYSNSPSSLRTSSNGGLGWVNRGFPNGSGTFSDYPFDPWAAAGMAGGESFASLIRRDTASYLARVVIARTRDGGSLWTRFYEATTNEFHDRAMFDVDRSAARGGGSGDAHDGSIYLTFDTFDANDDYVASYLQVISRAGALIRSPTISTRQEFWGSQQQPVSGIEDGQVYLMGQASAVDGRTTFLLFHELTGAASLELVKSYFSISDAGQPLGTSARLGVNGHRIGNGAVMDIDRSATRRRGTLYVLTARNPNPLDPTRDQGDIHLSISGDRAFSWVSAPLPGLAPGKTQFFPALHVDDEGWIHAAYYQNEAGATDGGVLNASSANVYYTLSSDGGLTWTPPVMVNGPGDALDYFDPPPDLADRSYYLIGDYFQIRTGFPSGARVVYACWNGYDKDRTDLYFDEKRDRVICTRLVPPADTDRDGIFEPDDNCPTLFNPTQDDADGDGTGDVCQDLERRANLDDDASSRGRIDGSDLFPLARGFGFCLGDPLYVTAADLNPDSCIDGYDLALLTSFWGQVVP